MFIELRSPTVISVAGDVHSNLIKLVCCFELYANMSMWIIEVA